MEFNIVFLLAMIVALLAIITVILLVRSEPPRPKR